MGLWDSWEDDALIVDKDSGRFADPDKVHRLDHEGKFFKSRGPFTVPRSPQGHPVLLQAGQSGRGMKFAGALGRTGLRRLSDLEAGRSSTTTCKAAVADGGPRPRPREDRAGGEVIVGETAAAGRGEARHDRASHGQADRRPGAAVRGAELRLRQAAATTSRSRDEELAARVVAQPARPRDRRQRQEEPVGARLRRSSGRGTMREGPDVRRHAEAGGRPDGGVVRAAPATASCCRPRTCRAPTKTSCAWSCPSCSAAALFRTRYRGHDAARQPGPDRAERRSLARGRPERRPA